MATGVSKLDLQGHTGLTEVANWISQVDLGGTVYDLATHHGIKFRNGAADTTGVTWNGITDIEVIIPSISDLVTNPIEFVGTVDANGAITWVDDNHSDANKNKGDLVYITADCTFGGVACEAGDMAIFDGTNWKIISGENQVEIVGLDAQTGVANVVLTATAQEVLKVEGKSLKLSIDYTGVYDVMSAEKNAETTLNVQNGTTTVASKYVGLSKAADVEKTIATDMSIDLPTALASGAVSISKKVLVSTDFSFNAGVLPSISMNADAISVSVSTSLNLGKTATTNGSTGDFVASIDGAVKNVTVSTGTSSSNDIAYVAAVSLVDDASKVYISQFRTAISTETPQLTVPGKVTVSNGTFVSGLGAAAASGDVVSSVEVGAVTFDSTKTDFVTGLSTAANDGSKAVITEVSFGTIASNATEWFVTGVSGATQVVTDVAVGETTFVSGNTTFASAAFVGASVNNNVLSFSTANFMKPVSLSKAADTVTKNNLLKGGVELSGQSLKSADFVKGGFTQASTSISYKSVLTGNVTLSYAADGKYMFDTAAVPALDHTMGYKKLDVTAAEIKYNGYQLNNNSFTGSIAAGAVATGISAGVLPSLSISAPSGVIEGTVSTALSTTNVSWLGVATAASKITLPGAYTLVSDSDANSGAIEVAAAGDYSLANATVTIASEAFLTDVKVSTSTLVK